MNVNFLWFWPLCGFSIVVATVRIFTGFWSVYEFSLDVVIV